MGDGPGHVLGGVDLLEKGVQLLAPAEMGHHERIPLPRDVEDEGHMGVAGDLTLGFEELALVDAQRYDHGQVEPKGVRIDDRDIARDGARSLQLLDAADDGGGGRAQLLGHLAVAFAGVGVQGANQLSIHGLDHRGLLDRVDSPPIWTYHTGQNFRRGRCRDPV
jgi:hypothetical protein